MKAMTWLVSSIRNKILGVFILGLGVVMAGALYGFAAGRSGLATVARVNDTLIAQSIQAQALESTFKEQVQNWMTVLVRGHDPSAQEKSLRQFTFREREVRRGGEKLLETLGVPAARDLLAKFLVAHKEMGEKYRAALDSGSTGAWDPRQIDAATKGLDLEPTEQLEDLVKMIRDSADTAVAEARKSAARAQYVSLAVIGVATLLALVFCGWLITRTVERPLKEAVGVVDRVAAGDLTVRVESASRDETGQLLGGLARMRDSLAGAVSVIRQSAETVGHASKEIAAGHADLSSRTEQQAASLEETASSMEQLASAVKQNATTAREANTLAAATMASAAKGGQAVDDVIATMGGISDSSRKIADIVGVIDSIAFQTNILALNAAVEAARAGEQGRGFAVVAAEVRALAQRSATAAREIKALIQSSAERVDEGTKLVEAAGATMQEFVVSVERVTFMMAQITAATQEQLAGIEQVGGAVTQMDRVVQQNAALVSQGAASTQHMADQADALMESVARFKLDSGAAQPAEPQQPEAVPAQRIERHPRGAPRLSQFTIKGLLT